MNPYRDFLQFAEKRRASVIEALKKNVPVLEIAQEFNLSPQRVYQIKYAEGIDTPQKKRGPNRKKKA